jgi:diguanylate cyclase (GGDEF)-like protein
MSAFSAVSKALTRTVSIGVAETNATMASIFDLIKLADKALYIAKDSGRNRVCAADDRVRDVTLSRQVWCDPGVRHLC